MRALASRDLRLLLDFLHEAYVVRSLDAFPEHVISRLPALVPSEITSFNEIDFPRRRCVGVSNPSGLRTRERTEIVERHIAEHPIAAHYWRTGDGRALKISDFLTMRQLRRLGLYAELYRPLRVTCQIAVGLRADPHLLVGFVASRGQPDFSERDRRILDTLRPHLVAAYRNAEAFTNLEREGARARGAVQAVGAELLWLSRGGRIREATGRARGWLAAYFGGSPPRAIDHLPDGLDRWLRSETATAGAADRVPPSRLPLVVEGTGGRLVVRLLPDRERPALLLEERRTATDAASLESLGLTRREAEVLAWVAQGKTNAEIAAILGTRPRTVHKHLDHILAKLGVENRTAATARALAWAATPSAPGGGPVPR
jgi:DNA-binding CsgD family transcriptional regulator